MNKKNRQEKNPLDEYPKCYFKTNTKFMVRGKVQSKSGGMNEDSRQSSGPSQHTLVKDKI